MDLRVIIIKFIMIIMFVDVEIIGNLVMSPEQILIFPIAVNREGF